MPPARGSPFPPHTGSHLRPAAAARPFSRRLPPQPPPACYFKHANLGDHLPAPKFSEKTKACEPAGLRFPAALGGAARRPWPPRPAWSRWQLAAGPVDELPDLSPGPCRLPVLQGGSGREGGAGWHAARAGGQGMGK